MSSTPRRDFAQEVSYNSLPESRCGIGAKGLGRGGLMSKQPHPSTPHQEADDLETVAWLGTVIKDNQGDAHET